MANVRPPYTPTKKQIAVESKRIREIKMKHPELDEEFQTGMYHDGRDTVAYQPKVYRNPMRIAR